MSFQMAELRRELCHYLKKINVVYEIFGEVD